jgi:hypothetical protein
MPSFKSLSSIPPVSLNLGPALPKEAQPKKDYRPPLPKGFSYNRFGGLSYSEPTPKSLEWVCFTHDEICDHTQFSADIPIKDQIGWQPLETCPKDKTTTVDFLFYSGKKQVVARCWTTIKELLIEGRIKGLPKPSHWRLSKK